MKCCCLSLIFISLCKLRVSDCCLLTNEQLFSYVIAGTSSEDDFQRFIMFKPIRSNGDHLGCLVTFNTEHNFGKGPSKEYITSRFEPVWDGWFLRRRSKCKMLILDNRRQAMGKTHLFKGIIPLLPNLS